MAEFRDHRLTFERLKVGVVAISTDEPLSAAAFCRSLDWPYPMLCDPTREVIARWGLLNEVENVARSAVFVIGPDRRVRWRSLDSTAHRVRAADVVRALTENGAVHSRLIWPRLKDLIEAILSLLRYGKA